MAVSGRVAAEVAVAGRAAVVVVVAVAAEAEGGREVEMGRWEVMAAGERADTCQLLSTPPVGNGATTAGAPSTAGGIAATRGAPTAAHGSEGGP